MILRSLTAMTDKLMRAESLGGKRSFRGSILAVRAGNDPSSPGPAAEFMIQGILLVLD